MTIKEAAAKTGLTEKNIRYYEAQGLIHPANEAQEDHFREKRSVPGID
ncbi:MerR family DNA-binding transcriptional regulator [Roseburia hominis]|nr:MerR family DNA-binding transcriptional regulator [Roseburia hominis]MCI7522964.1 MerR family DNA-binding transcriptional regulator [Roseburia hominis]